MSRTDMQFDNHDGRIKYYALVLERNLDGLPCFSLPEGYKFVFYKQGDRDSWIDIEKSAKEFVNYEQGLDAWNKYYAGHEEALLDRMVFIEDENGRKVATATAYYTLTDKVRPLRKGHALRCTLECGMTDHDSTGEGFLHWVSVRREYQGKGLSKPLISYVLDVMRGLGCRHAKITTQTTTWLACKIYLDFGFVPEPSNAVSSREGWEIVRALTNHPALASFAPAAVDDILAR